MTLFEGLKLSSLILDFSSTIDIEDYYLFLTSESLKNIEMDLSQLKHANKAIIEIIKTTTSHSIKVNALLFLYLLFIIFLLKLNFFKNINFENLYS